MFPLIYLAVASAPSAPANCSLRPDTDVIVFVDTAAGTGHFSGQWEHHFWAWWAVNDSGAPKSQFLNLYELEACSAQELLAVGTWNMPGGNAYTYTQHLGAAGKAKLTAFLHGGGLYVGTCAGWFYASKSYYWDFDTPWPDAGYWAYPSLLGAFAATVEGSITDIADEETAPGVFNGHALTLLSNGHKAIYYGGPTMGWHQTREADLPDGFEVLARFTGVAGKPPAIVRRHKPNGNGPRMLLSSPHLEAFEGIGVTELTTEHRLENYALRARLIRDMMEPMRKR